MGVFPANKVGRGQDNSESRAPTVAELSADQFNAALVDENGDAAFGTAGAVAALSALSVAEIETLDGGGLVGLTATPAELNLTDSSVEDVYADGIGLARIAKATYDFSVDGGSVSAIDLGVTIPANSIILGGLYDVVTTCTSATGPDSGTGALSVESANDLVSAVAISDGTNPWDQGLHAIVPVFTAGTAVKTTAAANITFTIAVDDFTAGKFHVILFYIPTVVDTA